MSEIKGAAIAAVSWCVLVGVLAFAVTVGLGIEVKGKAL